MSRIRGKDTGPEMVVRRWLWGRGYRYRLNYNRLPGKPDVVMRKYRTCIFINGCFWHGHNVACGDGVSPSVGSGTGVQVVQSSECCKIPKTNREFWVGKIMRNRERDVEVQHKLARMGWHCITIWECELKGDKLQKTLQSLDFTLNSIWLQHLKPYQLPDDEEIDMAAEQLPIGELIT